MCPFSSGNANSRILSVLFIDCLVFLNESGGGLKYAVTNILRVLCVADNISQFVVCFRSCVLGLCFDEQKF